MALVVLSLVWMPTGTHTLLLQSSTRHPEVAPVLLALCHLPL